MRTLAIGDIHGCLTALDALLAIAQPQADDLLVTLGDYVDRGPNSRGVLDRLIALQAQCRLVPLKGNHDLMMMESRGNPDAYLDWFHCGGIETLESYGGARHWDRFADAVPGEHWRFLEATCVPHHEIDAHFFVHANAYADIAISEQPDHMLYWEKFVPPALPHQSGKVMICGHTAQRSGIPLALPHVTCIDTWVYGDGWLTCLDVLTGEYWQTNEQGQTRSSRLTLDD